MALNVVLQVIYNLFFSERSLSHKQKQEQAQQTLGLLADYDDSDDYDGT